MDEDFLKDIRHWLRAEPVRLPDAVTGTEFSPVIPVPRSPSE